MAKELGTETRQVAGAITSMGVDELISNLAIGIAKGQMQLDQVCMDIARFMGEAQIAFGKRADSDEPDYISLIELGFTPNFYQFVDTILEVRVAVSSHFEEKQEYDTSDTRQHEDEAQAQSSYASQSSGSSSGYGYGGGWSYGWGWGHFGHGWGGSGWGSSSYGASQSASSSSMKNKNISLTTIDAKYASTYNYSVEASSVVKTKIVPVPPPQVFDERVRAKAQERKEWEKRMRMLKQVKAIIPGLIKTAGELADTNNIPSSAVSPDKVQLYRDQLLGLREEYDKLGTDHWAVITGVKDRAFADTKSASITENAENFVSSYETDSSLSYDDIKIALLEDLGAFATKMQEILDRLPLTPEEQALAEQNTETNAAAANDTSGAATDTTTTEG